MHDSQHPLYSTWLNMIQRCYNENSRNYVNYGARGIRVYLPWYVSFKRFVEDMGPKPVGTTLDRIDVNKDYEPSNCRWADQETQRSNTRKLDRRKFKVLNRKKALNYTR